MVGTEGIKIFDFDNHRLLQKALLGTELHQKLCLTSMDAKKNPRK